MADVPESLQTIDVNEVSYRSAVSEATLTKIAGTINSFIKSGTEAIGTIEQSILSESQFQTIRGTKWVRMEGQDITGSDLALLTGETTLPDTLTKGLFFRQANLTESNLKNIQTSQNLSHNHFERKFKTLPDPADPIRLKNGTSGTAYGGEIASHNGDASGSDLTTDFDGGSETRPENLVVNYFIKINN